MTAMTATLTKPTTALRKPGWLLLASLPPFIAFLFVAASTLSDKVESAANLTTDQLADIRPAWILMNALWAIPVALGAFGLFVLAGRVPGRLSLVVRILAPIAVVLMTVYFVVQLLMLGTEGPTLGDSPTFTFGMATSVFGFWAALVATIAACLDLIRRRVARKTALVIAVLSALYLVFDLLTYLPAFVGEPQLAETTGLPPFLASVFWAVLGGGLLKSRVPSGE